MKNYGEKLYVLDAKELGINRLDSSVAEYFNHLVFSSVLNNVYLRELSRMPKSIRTRTGAICGRWNTKKRAGNFPARFSRSKMWYNERQRKRKGRNTMTEQEMRAAIAQHVKPLVCFEGWNWCGVKQGRSPPRRP